MIDVSLIHVDGFEAAIRGMRNPLNSWDKSDTISGEYHGNDENGKPILVKYDFPQIGQNDKTLMLSLVKAGSDHRKFMRMINVTMDIKAPLYWWKEFDTYKVGTVANSCSTMHKIHAKEFGIEDFSVEHLDAFSRFYFNKIVALLNHARASYEETKDKNEWWQIIQVLPSSYNQLRTVQLNYEVLYNIYFARKEHKLDEWRIFCETILTLPLMDEIITEEK